VLAAKAPKTNPRLQVGEDILDFRVDNLAHDRMSCFASEIERRCLNVALLGQRPLVVLGCQLADGILIFGPGDDGLEGFGSILGLGGASDARNTGNVSPGVG
jgi:hypothetical protein